MDFLRSLRHPEEIYNLLRFKMGGCRAVMSQQERDSMRDSLQTCYKHLNETGRSLAAIIQALDGELRDAMCIFYLVLRALDTVEDDMTISLETKILMLHNFHTYLYQADWRFTESKDKHRQVLEDFPTISLEFRKLAIAYQEVIADTCRKMGAGLVEFLGKRMESFLEWHELFASAGLEGVPAVEDTKLLNSIGILQQKTNAIRDYLEDQLEGREFWPREVWSKYGKKLSDLAKPENIVPAVQCLNELVTNALQHVPDVLLYLSRLRNQSELHFFATQQVIAVATLAACYNNQQVFKGVVKIRKGQAVTVMLDATNIQAVRAIVYHYVNEIYRKIPVSDPSAETTQNMVSNIQTLCLSNGPLVSRHGLSPIYLSCAVLLATLSWYYLLMHPDQ